ncbi:enoyl-CoA hydratase/isomerase family protein [Nocardioides nitrophenolicus]|uniref:enoyl-CoA hydratase/isomerase family protein n=1 Tax=Nocardioides nitrophenolicus TaxID=60489 RepID=UPI00195DA28A|nr:enoyl-CoA hydratase-related protein [Nocardioides nitrophenolicus]MBM7516463.1 enoyl-CoA hydratase/carnithine racemase [Nocardioides nitrophenolicus]
MGPAVVASRRGSLAVLTLNRPDERNPLNAELSAALLVGLREAYADDGVRSVAIAAAGSAFSAGGDLRQMRELAAMPAAAAWAWPAGIVELHQLALESPKPLIAVVDGPAFAGGMGLAGACDIVLAGPRASFAMPEVRLGLFPMIIVAHLVRALPRKVLLDLMLTGRAIDAEEAARVGLVARVCADEEALWAAADDYAAMFEETSPDALRLGRRAFGLLADLPAPQALDAAQFLNLAFFHGTDLAEGAAAFLDRRPAPWTPAARAAGAPTGTGE